MPFDSHSHHQAGQGIKDLTLGFQVIITFLPYSLKLCTGSSSLEWNWIAAKPTSLLTSHLMCFSPSDSCTIMCGVLLLSPAEKNFFLVLGDPYVSPLAIDLFFFFNFFIFFIYFWLHWVFVAVHALSLVVANGDYSSLRCTGFSLWWLLLLRSTGFRCTGVSSCGSQALERRLSSCGAWAQLLRGMWDLPRPGFEPVSPALAGEFLTTVPPGKPWPLILISQT